MCEHHETSPQRRLILQALATGSLLSFSANGAPRSIHHLKGRVLVNGRLAQYDTLIKAGDNVETLRDSSIVFVVDKDAYMLRENSRLSLIVKNSVIDTLRLFSGKLLSVFGSGQKKLQTPIATIGIRGTGTYMTAEPSKTYFCTCYGTVDIASWQSSKMLERVTGTHHNARIITASNKQSWNMLPAKFEDHSDDELIMLESLVGRKPPFAV
ncbi:MAG: hypothetical protein ISR69_09810 [Gammaproteobacteria bacterium]|nr:hypothetical protein [Gammaproteobacteria bacterium]